MSNCKRWKNTVKIFAVQGSILDPILREQNRKSQNYKSDFYQKNKIEL